MAEVEDWCCDYIKKLSAVAQIKRFPVLEKLSCVCHALVVY